MHASGNIQKISPEWGNGNKLMVAAADLVMGYNTTIGDKDN